MEAHAVVAVGVADNHPFPPNRDVDCQLLFNLAPAGFWQRLAALTLPSGKLPQHGQEPFFGALRDQDTTARLGLLWQHTEFAPAWEWARRLGAVSLHPYWRLVSEEVVNEAHAYGLQVLTWTVNDVETMRELVRCGVDGIISDHPERFSAMAD